MTTTPDRIGPTASKSRPSMRAWGAAAAVIVAAVAGCTSGRETGVPIASQPGAPVASQPGMPATSGPASAGDDAPAGSGIVAKPASTAFPMEARDIRLVRVDQQDIALQFELFNGTQETVEPYDMGWG